MYILSLVWSCVVEMFLTCRTFTSPTYQQNVTEIGPLLYQISCCQTWMQFLYTKVKNLKNNTKICQEKKHNY